MRDWPFVVFLRTTTELLTDSVHEAKSLQDYCPSQKASRPVSVRRARVPIDVDARELRREQTQ